MCKRSRIFILGAGFSKPAGLPLGNGLLSVINDITNNPEQKIFHEYKEKFLGKLQSYQEFSKIEDLSKINIENFIEYVDYENYLQYNGGNDNERGGIQDIIRFLIAKSLRQKQISIQNEDLYRSFTSNLNENENDIIFTLNYDTILESLIESYALFPYNSRWLCKQKLNIPFSPRVTLIKLHGSINWFDISEHARLLMERCITSKNTGLTPDFIFNNQHDKIEPQPLIDLAYETIHKSHLNRIYHISPEDLDSYLDAYNNRDKRSENNLPQAMTHPVILSPASSKLLYSDPIKDLFYGANMYGRDCTKFVIIGCGLPQHDKYINQFLYGIMKQYFGMHQKKPGILVINNAKFEHEKDEIENNYKFLNSHNIEFNHDGFTKKCFDKIFSA